MAIRLYHLTSRENAALIKKNGFRDSIDGGVWFAEHPTQAWGAQHESALLEVIFKCPISEIECFSVLAEIEGEPVKWTLYLIPTPFMHGKIIIRRVSSKRRKRLMML